MSSKIERLVDALQNVFGDKILSLHIERQEAVLVVQPEDYLAVAEVLRDHTSLRFEQLIDLCGVDYKTYAGEAVAPSRYGVVSQLLSISQNWRLRLKVFCRNDEFPIIDSVCAIWPSVNWFEREAFDLFGIMFNEHPDLRRILTDYGFIGHPFRKDFPVSGFMEMRYDADQGRVIYQPVTIEPREVTPRIVREKSYGDTSHG